MDSEMDEIWGEFDAALRDMVEVADLKHSSNLGSQLSPSVSGSKDSAIASTSSSCTTPTPSTCPSTSSSNGSNGHSSHEGRQLDLNRGLNHHKSSNGGNWSRMRRKDSSKSSKSSRCSADSTTMSSDSSMAFDCDFGPNGTTKRRPNLNSNPIIPLTSTTRNLAKQSDDALLDMESRGDHHFNANCAPMSKNVQYGTLRMRRSHTDERLARQTSQTSSNYEASCHRGHSRSSGHSSISSRAFNHNQESMSSDDDIELPLPPPPEVLKSSLSTLSLTSLPPPPDEFLDSPTDSSTMSHSKSSSSSSEASLAIEVAPSSRYNSFDRRGGTLTRHGQKSRKPSAKSSYFGTAPRVGVSSRSANSGAQLVNPVPPSVTSVTPLNHNLSKLSFKPMYSSSSSCSSREDVSSSSCQSMSEHIVHFSPEAIMLQQLEADVHSDLPPPPPALRTVTDGHNGRGHRGVPIYDSVFTYRKNNGFPLGNEHGPSTSVDSSTFVVKKERPPPMASFNCPPRESLRSPMKGPLPPPPANFLANLKRVMDKKWKVAQTLGVDPDQLNCDDQPIYGFRDPRMLPSMANGHQGQQLVNNGQQQFVDCGHRVPPSQYDVPRVPANRINDRQPNGFTDCHPLPIPAPFFRKSSSAKPQSGRAPPAPPKRSDQTRLSQRKLLH